MSLLEVERVSSFYGDFQALSDVSLSVEAGETFAIIGANGAGKSTLLNVISGLFPNRGGVIRFDDQPIDRLSTHQRVQSGISLVPEGRRVFPSLTVRENLLIGAYRKRKGPWNVNAAMDLFPLLAHLADKHAAVLSGGEQQALAIARALMANPRLLMLDEVSLGLAPIVVGQLYRAIPAIAAAGITILLVEQNIEQALAASSRVCCLLEGRIVLTGRPAELTRDAIVQAYFGI
jgi:branched-chain amino acid transport system ATP-binding protein